MQEVTAEADAAGSKAFRANNVEGSCWGDSSNDNDDDEYFRKPLPWQAVAVTPHTHSYSSCSTGARPSQVGFIYH